MKKSRISANHTLLTMAMSGSALLLAITPTSSAKLRPMHKRLPYGKRTNQTRVHFKGCFKGLKGFHYSHTCLWMGIEMETIFASAILQHLRERCFCPDQAETKMKEREGIRECFKPKRLSLFPNQQDMSMQLWELRRFASRFFLCDANMRPKQNNKRESESASKL